jgi:hypothetical protein
MKKGILVLAFFIGSALGNLSIAQLDQTERLEIPISWREQPFELFPWFDHGLLLFREIPDYDFQKNGWELKLVRPDLEMAWEVSFEEQNGYEVSGWDVGESEAYMLLEHRNDKTRDFIIKSFSLSNGMEKSYSIPSSIPLMLSHFEVLGNRILLGGMYNLNPVVLLGNLQAGTSATLPGIFRDNSALIDIRKDVINGRFTVLVQERDIRKNYTIAVKNFDESGTLLEDIVLEIPDHKALLSGRVTTPGSRGQRVVGTYARRKSTFPEGIFVAGIPSNGEPVIRYYPFGELNNFFNFMSEKRSKRHQVRHEGDEDKVARPINYQVAITELREGNREDMLIATLLKSDARSVNTPLFNPWSFRTRNWGRTQPLGLADNWTMEGGNHISAFTIGIGTDGRVNWDQSMELSDIEVNDQIQHISVARRGMQVLYLYNIENELRYQVTEGNNMVVEKQEESIELPYEEDKERTIRPDTYGTLFWYDDVFIAFGIQRIKNPGDEVDDRDRKVFYINKIRF